MKRNVWIVGVAALLLTLVPLVSAQVTLPVATTTSITGTVKIEIPFKFSLDGKNFHSGSYLISPLTDKTAALRSEDGKQSAVVMTSPVTTANNVSGPKLVFHRYGDDYFLTQAWLRQSDTGREFPMSADEIRMAREYSQQQVILVSKK